MNNQLLPTTYFGPVSWYRQLHRAGRVVIDAGEPWVKQTFRNRCTIATAAGTQTLTVPVVHTGRVGTPVKEIRISDHGNWRHLHWQAISSAYGHSPFFQFYEDDLRPFFFENRWEYLFDFNFEIMQKMCELLDINAPSLPQHYSLPQPAPCPHREGRIDGQCSCPPPPCEGSVQVGGGCRVRPYWQVFQQKHGFLPDLSILDLLCCMGNEAIYYL